MRIVVPSTETQINAAQEGHGLIDDDHFLVMRPHEAFAWQTNRVSQHFDELVFSVAGEHVLHTIAQHFDHRRLQINFKSIKTFAYSKKNNFSTIKTILLE